MASMMPHRPMKATKSKTASPAAALDAQLNKSAADATANSKGNNTYCHMIRPSPSAVAMHFKSDIGQLSPESHFLFCGKRENLGRAAKLPNPMS
jgi:hypothetical protein